MEDYSRESMVWTQAVPPKAGAMPEGLEVPGTINVCTWPWPELEK